MRKPMSSISNPGLHRQIAEKAYELFQSRGHVHGHDLDDWVEAERRIMATLDELREWRPPDGRAAKRKAKAKPAPVRI